MKLYKYFLLIILLPLYLFSSNIENISNHKNWFLNKYFDSNDGKDVYYIGTFGKNEEGNFNVRKDTPYILLSCYNGNYEFSVSPRFNFIDNITLEFRNGKKYLSSNSAKNIGEVGWLNDEDDKNIINSLKSNATLHSTSYSYKGTYAKDTYSLTEFQNAFKELSNKCK